MNATRRCAVFTALLAMSAPVAAASDEPDALEILKKADAATKAVKAFSCKAEFRGTGGIANGVPTIQGTVQARQARPGVLGLIFGAKHGRPSQRIKGEFTPPGAKTAEPFEIASDGKRAVLIDVQRKILTRGELPEAEAMLKTGLPLYMIELLHPTPFTDEITAKETRCEGVEDVEGVACDVVFVVYHKSDIDSRWYIGRADSLPRRVERLYGRLGRPGSTVLTLTDLVVAPSLGASDFAPSTPKGYRVKTFQPPLRLGQRAPNWKLPAPDGKIVSLESLRGNVVVLSFWATWCDYCKQSMPAMQALHEQYAERPVKVFGINCWETDGDPVAYMKSANRNLPILLGGDKVADKYRVNCLPTFFVIDAKGRIAYIGSGMLQAREMTMRIEMAAAGFKSEK
jgi:cytochrome c biogenesis protein CcmG/thiol:disulfide interchange protein DsbE